MHAKQQLRLDDGRRLAFHDFGEGAPTLYLHGLPSSSHELFAVPAAQARHPRRWVAPDRPGYGDSDHDPRRSARSWADDLARLLDHLRLPAVRLLCVSGGTPGALAFCRHHPQRVEKLAVLCGMGMMGSGAERRLMAEPLRLGIRSARFIPGFARAVFHPGTRPLTYPVANLCRAAGLRLSQPRDRAAFDDADFRAAIEESWRQAFSRGGPGMAADLGIWTRDAGAWLGELRLPVAWWHGDADRVVPHAVGAMMASRIPGCRLHTRAGAGHFAIIHESLDEALAWLA